MDQGVQTGIPSPLDWVSALYLPTVAVADSTVLVPSSLFAVMRQKKIWSIDPGYPLAGKQTSHYSHDILCQICVYKAAFIAARCGRKRKQIKLLISVSSRQGAEDAHDLVQ